MPKQETMEAIENTLESVENTVQTLERIPKVNLNGTTRSQQILILSTVAVAGVTFGVLGNNAIRKVGRKLRRKSKRNVVLNDVSTEV